MRACARCGAFIEREQLCEPCRLIVDLELIRAGEAVRRRNNAWTGAFISAVALATGVFLDVRILFGCFAGIVLSGRELGALFSPKRREELGDRLAGTSAGAIAGSVLGALGVLALLVWFAFRNAPA